MGLPGVASGMGHLSWMKRRKGVGVFWRKLRRMRLARTHGAALAGLAILAGFGCEASPAPASTSRDSLGVRIVESVVPAWSADSAWWIEEVPLVDLLESGTGEERFFDRVRDVLRAADGRLIVADLGSSEVRIYDSSGRFVRVFGGEGDGPGEFRYLAALVLLRNGRLVAQDLAMGGRDAEFDLDSGLVSSFRRPRMVDALRQPVPSDFLWGIDHMSAFLVAMNSLGLQRPLATIVRLSDDRASSHTVATVPGHEVFIATDADATPLMERKLHAVATGDGELVIGTADRLEYSKLDGATGDLRMIARIPGVSLAVSREELDRERRVRLGPDPRPHIREIFELLPEPAEKPAYQRMIVDVEGNVWAGEYLGLARRHDPQKWYVWDSSGVWLGIVETPARFELMRVGADEVFGVRRDFNEVESPQVLRLHKGRSQ